jgi:hypothetical protein
MTTLIDLQVQEGDTCGDLSVTYSIALADFYFLNPNVNSQCTNLFIGIAYCVQAVGAITTYSGYPASMAANTTALYTLTSETFTMDSWTTITPTSPAFTATPTNPLAPGTWINCSLYVDGKSPPVVVDQSVQTTLSEGYDPKWYFCNNTAAVYAEAMADFLNWNPSLVNGNATGNCTLLPNYRYCASLTGQGW